MATARPFAYYTGDDEIPNTIRVGNILIAQDGYDFSVDNGIQWWNGPDEELGYIIPFQVPGLNQSNPVGIPAGLKFKRSLEKTDESLIQLVNKISTEEFSTISNANSWLEDNQLWSSYPAVEIDTDAQAFLDAAKPFFSPTYYDDIGLTENQFDRAISDYYVALKDAGIYSKLKAFYPIVGGTAGAHKFNGKDPRDLDAAFRLSFFGGVTHSIGGMQGNGTNGYAKTNLFRNDFSLDGQGGFAYSRTNNANDGYDFGTTVFGSNEGTIHLQRRTNNAVAIKNETIDSDQSLTSDDSLGLYGHFRISSNQVIAVKRSIKSTINLTRVLSGDNTNDFILMGNNRAGVPSNFINRYYAGFYFTNELLSEEYDDFLNSIEELQTKLNRNV